MLEAVRRGATRRFARAQRNTNLIQAFLCLIAASVFLLLLMGWLLTSSQQSEVQAELELRRPLSEACGCERNGLGGPRSVPDVEEVRRNARSRYAVATTIATDSYVPGAMALLHTVRMHGFKGAADVPDLIVVVTPDVSDQFLDVFRSMDLIVFRVDEWHPGFPGFPKRWKGTFSKLHLWTLDMYEKILFLDPDIILIDSMADVFLQSDARLQSRWKIDPHHPSRIFCDGGMFLLLPRREDWCGLLCQHNSASSTRFEKQGEQLLIAEQFLTAGNKSDVSTMYEGERGPCHKLDYDTLTTPDAVLRSAIADRCIWLHYYGRKPWEPAWFRPWFYPGRPAMRTGVDRLWWDMAPVEAVSFPYVSVFLRTLINGPNQLCWYLPPHPGEYTNLSTWKRFPIDPMGPTRTNCAWRVHFFKEATWILTAIVVVGYALRQFFMIHAVSWLPGPGTRRRGDTYMLPMRRRPLQPDVPSGRASSLLPRHPWLTRVLKGIVWLHNLAAACAVVFHVLLILNW